MLKSVKSKNNILRKSNSTHCDVRMVAFLDPENDMFMRVAQHAYKDHLDNLVPCSKCERKFFPDRIERHQETCAADPVKISNKKCPKSGNKKNQQELMEKVKVSIKSCSSQTKTNNQKK